jgi:hypothetical protein
MLLLVNCGNNYRQPLFHLYFSWYILTNLFRQHISIKLLIEYIEFEKKNGSMTWKLLLAILPIDLLRNSKRDLHTVT